MPARIYQVSKMVNQSGQARTGHWLLEFESGSRAHPDPLTGWAGGTDTQSQVTLSFESMKQAAAYAEREGITYHVVPSPSAGKMRLQSYADNFR